MPEHPGLGHKPSPPADVTATSRRPASPPRRPEARGLFCHACGFPLTEQQPDKPCTQCGHRACPSCAD